MWDVKWQAGRIALTSLFVGGLLLVPFATFMLDHFDLFGTRQVWLHLRAKAYRSTPFRVPFLYRSVRHPLYVGWMASFWASPTMTAGHLLFAITLTAYMLIAVRFEERDLVEFHGERYAAYRRQVPGFIPRLGRRGAPTGVGSTARWPNRRSADALRARRPTAPNPQSGPGAPRASTLRWSIYSGDPARSPP